MGCCASVQRQTSVAVDELFADDALSLGKGFTVLRLDSRTNADRRDEVRTRERARTHTHTHTTHTHTRTHTNAHTHTPMTHRR